MKKPWYRRRVIVVPITVALIGLIGAITPIIYNAITSNHTPTKLEVNITAPLQNSIISGDSIQIEGYLSKPLSNGQYLYTVVEATTALWWPTQVVPTYSQISESYEFKCTQWIKLDNGSEILEIKVIMVDLAIHDNFQAWRSNCVAADDWPGIPIANVYEWGEWETCASVTVIYE
jgi:hypothetical protein